MKTSIHICLILSLIAMVAFASVAAAEPPSWDTQINKPGRFKVLEDFKKEAVLDQETGLVWEQSPDKTARTWSEAHTHCNIRTVGGRKGWRLPTIQELASLVDPNNPGGNPDLPPGHPFANVQSAFYYSATIYVLIPTHVWLVAFNKGVVFSGGKTGKEDLTWCVRGGQGVDPH